MILKSLKGFTLLELTVIIFIAGLAAGITVLAIGRIHEKTVFRETTNKLYNTLKQARHIALMQRAVVVFKYNAENNTFWLEKENNIYGRVIKIPETITISGDTVTFFSKGNSSGGIIKIKDNKDREYSIEIDPILGIPKINGI